MRCCVPRLVGERARTNELDCVRAGDRLVQRLRSAGRYREATRPHARQRTHTFSHVMCSSSSRMENVDSLRLRGWVQRVRARARRQRHPPAPDHDGAPQHGVHRLVERGALEGYDEHRMPEVKRLLLRGGRA